jgi:hypothetical protein
LTDRQSEGGPETIEGWPDPIPAEQFTGVSRICRVYREHRSRPAVGLPFASFPQQVLAFAFVLARSGDGAARHELAEYIRAYEIAPATAKKLEALIEQAAT